MQNRTVSNTTSEIASAALKPAASARGNPANTKDMATKMNQPAKIVVINAASCTADSFWTRARMRARLKFVIGRQARESVTESLDQTSRCAHQWRQNDHHRRELS